MDQTALAKLADGLASIAGMSRRIRWLLLSVAFIAGFITASSLWVAAGALALLKGLGAGN